MRERRARRSGQSESERQRALERSAATILFLPGNRPIARGHNHAKQRKRISEITPALSEQRASLLKREARRARIELARIAITEIANEIRFNERAGEE